MANINLIKQVREADINAAFEREIRTGFELERTMRDERLKQAAIDAHRHDPSKTAGALGKPVLSIPAREFFRIRDNYGADCFNDRGFIRDYQRLVPDAKIARA